MEDLVPARVGGAHSSVGRATNRGMDKPRALAVKLENESRKALEERKELAERIAAERAQGIPENQRGAKPSSAPKGSTEEEGSPAKKKSSIGAKYPVTPDKAVSSTPMGRAVRERLNLNINPGSQEPVIGQKEPQSPLGLSLLPEDSAEKTTLPTSPTNKPSPAFTTQGTAAQVFSEGARIQLRRFFLEGKKSPSNPEVGHYRVQHTAVDGRIKVSEFGARAKHPSRSQPELRDTTRELGPEDLTALSHQWGKSGSLFAHPSMFSTSTEGQNQSMSESTSSWKGQSLMSTATERPALNNILGSRNGLASSIRMTELSEPNNAADQDRLTSTVRRVPECDLSNQTARPSFFGKGQFENFEVGKYAVNHDAVLPNAKKLTGFHHQMSRSAPAGFQKGQLGSLADSHHPDRSVYRQALISRSRITHVMEMSKDLDRPPMFGSSQILHDTSDPEVNRMVHEHAMTFDADTVDVAVRPRSDKTVHMGHSITREKAGLGSRMRKAYGGSDTLGQAETPVERLKDSLRTRSDLGMMTFDQCKARGPTRLKGVYSALHRPRDHAAPDFFRAPPFDGFNTRTPVARTQKVHPASRTHDAMPGWSVETVDVLMKSDVDG